MRLRTTRKSNLPIGLALLLAVVTTSAARAATLAGRIEGFRDAFALEVDDESGTLRSSDFYAFDARAIRSPNPPALHHVRGSGSWRLTRPRPRGDDPVGEWRYEIASLSPGEYVLVGGNLSRTDATIPGGPVPVILSRVTIPEGAGAEDTIVHDLSVPPPESQRRIVIRFVDATTGSGIENVEIQLHFLSYKLGSFQSDAEGRIVIEGLVDGDFTIRYDHDAYWVPNEHTIGTRRRGIQLDSRDAPFAVDGDHEYEIRLHPAPPPGKEHMDWERIWITEETEGTITIQGRYLLPKSLEGTRLSVRILNVPARTRDDRWPDKQILGPTPLEPDGSFRFEVTGNARLELLDEDGNVLHRDEDLPKALDLLTYPLLFAVHRLGDPE